MVEEFRNHATKLKVAGVKYSCNLDNAVQPRESTKLYSGTFLYDILVMILTKGQLQVCIKLETANIGVPNSLTILEGLSTEMK